MQLPFSPRVIYRNNPLVGVTCQLNFPAILRINTEPPASFQDRIRQQYPVFQEMRGMNFEITLPPQLASVVNQPVRLGNITYQFVNDVSPDMGVWTVSLTQEALTVSTSKYLQWEDFRHHLKEPLKALVDIYSPAFFTRIGLRYQDVIRRSELGLDNVPWKELLNPQIVGMFSAVDDESDVEVDQSQVIMKLDEDRKILLQHGLLLDQARPEYYYLIDNDFYLEKRTETRDAEDALDALNQASGRFFRWCITDKLHRALEPDSIR
jgi:uncharacterized protein (TIGR04255 family)